MTPSQTIVRLEHTAEIDCAPEAVYARAQDVERYPEFLPGYVSSRIIEREKGRALIEREASVQGKPYQWRSWVRFEPGQIHFEHASGPLRGMRVRWTFTPLPAGRTHLSIVHEMEPSEHVQKVGDLAAQVVQAFKRACEETPS
jgi:ribosome-associated toxin RatA of RatAB toxin-antitoxin module